MSDEPTEAERLLRALHVVTWEGEPVSAAVERVIAQARREAWDEGWLIGFSNCTGTAGGRTANPYRPDTWGNHMGDAPADAPAALRGDDA